MNTIQNYGTNYGSYKQYYPNFTAYDIKVVTKDLENGIIPSEAVIKEIETDVEKLLKSPNFEDRLKRIDLSRALREISKLKIKAGIAANSLRISILKSELASKPEKKGAIERQIAEINELTQRLEKALKDSL